MTDRIGEGEEADGASEPLRFEARYLFKDLVEENAAALKMALVRAALVGAVIYALAMSLTGPHKNPPPPDYRTRAVVGAVVPTVLLLPLAIFAPRIASLPDWYLILKRRVMWPISIEPTGVSMAYGDGTATTFPWSQFTHVTETRSLLLLWKPRSPLVLSLPKRDLAEAGIEAQLRSVLKRRGLARARWTRPGKQNGGQLAR